MNPEAITRKIDGLRGVGVVLLILGVALLAVSFSAGQVQFFHAYLYSYIFWFSMTIGCFGMLLLHNLVRGSFGYPVVRMFEAGGGPGAMLLMAVLFIPIILGFGDLYPWAMAKYRDVPIMLYRQNWMNPTLVCVRTFVFYFGVWWFVAYFLRRLSLDQDRTGNTALAQVRTNIAAFGMVYGIISGTLAFTDWVMSLDLYWSSTIYGAWLLVGSALLATAFATFLMTRWWTFPPYTGLDLSTMWRDLGNMTLTLVMLWGYTAISQFLLIWSADLPDEISYYLRRNSGGWLFVGALLIVGQFFGPFLALLSGKTKRDAGWRLTLLMAWIILMRVTDTAWVVIPAYGNTLGAFSPLVALSYAGAFLAIGGVWLWLFGTQLKSAPLIASLAAPLPEVLDHA